MTVPARCLCLFSRRFFRISSNYSSHIIRHYSILSISKPPKPVLSSKVEGWMQYYENLVGLKEVGDAQEKVIKAERLFTNVQAERRDMQLHLTAVQEKIRDLNLELDKVQRGEERYLTLLTEEHGLIREEKRMADALEVHEQLERDSFASLSSAVRESHEKERVRAERTKYWSIIGSVIGAIIGIVGTSLNNYLRMRELRGLVRDSAEGSSEMKGLVVTLSDAMRSQNNQLQVFLKELQGLVGMPGHERSPLPASSVVSAQATPEEQTQEILELMKRQDELVQKDMNDIKRMLAVSSKGSADVVYVGPEVQDLLEQSEKNLEWRMKLNALWTVTFIYGAFALTLPVLYNFFKGS